MPKVVVDKLLRPISPDRLEAYRPLNGTDDQMLSVYFWNMTLSEALYPSLHALEIALRNSIHQAAAATFRNDMWFSDTTIVRLDSHAQRRLNGAIKRLKKQEQRTPEKPITPGRLIAELNLGFWVSLFDKPHEMTLWRNPTTDLLRITFPGAPRHGRRRSKFEKRLGKIRDFRNRVFHHEPIWNWPKPDLPTQHTEILETIGWISPELQETIRFFDRFPAIYSTGSTGCLSQLAGTHSSHDGSTC